MSFLSTIWRGQGTGGRTGIVAGVVFIVAAVAALAVWSLTASYQVLFADLGQRDAAAMTAELDKLKVPYRLEGDGNTILVPAEQVHKTRLKLMAGELPLHGGVGFEVFNNADFGMTEFVQKVNYQRAVQGELTRTIQAIENVQSARVHLAIPEQGLFKKTVNHPKASVTIAMKRDTALSHEQTVGIARLVAAAVPEMQTGDVTIVDQHGNALTGAAGEADLQGGAQLDSKRSTEEYLARKAARVLDSTFGPGQAVASVDVVLNLDQSKVTTEEVLPARGAATGLAVRQRVVNRDADADGLQGARPDEVKRSTETEYQAGRRVEQLSVAAGTIRRMTVAVMVQPALHEIQREQLKEIVAMAVGLNPERGDAIVLYSADRIAPVMPHTDAAAPAAPDTAQALPQAQRAEGFDTGLAVRLLLAAFLVIAVALLLYRRRRAVRVPQPAALSAGEREALLRDVRGWIGNTGDAVAFDRSKP